MIDPFNPWAKAFEATCVVLGMWQVMDALTDFLQTALTLLMR